MDKKQKNLDTLVTLSELESLHKEKIKDLQPAEEKEAGTTTYSSFNVDESIKIGESYIDNPHTEPEMAENSSIDSAIEQQTNPQLFRENLSNNIHPSEQNYEEEEVVEKKQKKNKKDEPLFVRIKKFLNIKTEKEKFIQTQDAKATKKFAWLAYILFFIPLLINKESKFVRLHANEGLDTNIIDVVAIILMIVGKNVATTSIVTSFILHFSFILGLGLIALTTITKVIMIISCLRGRAQQTPWLWKTRIIK